MRIDVRRTSLRGWLIPAFIALACAGCSSPGDKYAAGSGSTAKKTTQRAKDAAVTQAEQELQRANMQLELLEVQRRVQGRIPIPHLEVSTDIVTPRGDQRSSLRSPVGPGSASCRPRGDVRASAAHTCASDVRLSSVAAANHACSDFRAATVSDHSRRARKRSRRSDIATTTPGLASVSTKRVIVAEQRQEVVVRPLERVAAVHDERDVPRARREAWDRRELRRCRASGAPVPSATVIWSSTPRPAPNRCSAHAAALPSFSTVRGILIFGSSSSLSGIPSTARRFGEKTTLFSCARIRPGTARHTPPTWGPFPDVPPALAQLRQLYKCKLAIITNSDDDLMARNVANIGVPGVNSTDPAKYEGHYREDKPEKEERKEQVRQPVRTKHRALLSSPATRLFSRTEGT